MNDWGVSNGRSHLIPVMMALCATTLSGQDTPVRPQTDTIAVSFALSGGVSNGSYQAGVLSSVLAFMRASNAGTLDSHVPQPRRFVVHGTTGASAGSINGIAVPLTWCAPASTPLTQSLLWEMWIPVGLSQLLTDPDRPGKSVFSRDFFEKRQLPLVRSALQSARCPSTIVLGFTMTRETPFAYAIGKPEMSVPVQRAVTAFELDRHGIRYSDRLDSTSRAGVSVRVGTEAEDAVLDVLLASSAFPVAFEPYALTYRFGGQVDSARFLDGGVFENNPLPLLRALTSRDPQTPTRIPWMVAVAPGLRPAGASIESEKETGVGQLARSLSLVTTGRAYELSLLLRSDEDAEWLGNLRPTIRYSPTFGPTIISFGGFLSRSFREHDFLAGARDGLRYVATHWACGSEGCPVDSVGVDRIARGLVSVLPEFTSDSVASRVVLAALSPVDSLRLTGSLRERTLLFYAAKAAALDDVPASKRLTGAKAECTVNEIGPACSSGLWHVLDALNRALGPEIRAAATTCVWDRERNDWRFDSTVRVFTTTRQVTTRCRDAGFFESGDSKYLRRRHIDFRYLMDTPTEGLDVLAAEVALRVYRGNLAELGGPGRAAWWVTRSALPPTKAAVVDKTHSLGTGRIRRALVPYRVSLSTPVDGDAHASTLRLSHILEGGQRGVIGLQVQAGVEMVFPDALAIGKRYASAFGSIGGRLMLTGVTLEAGAVVTRSSELRRALLRSSPVFLKVTLLDAVELGVEYGEAVAGNRDSQGARISAGLNDVSGLVWLITGK